MLQPFQEINGLSGFQGLFNSPFSMPTPFAPANPWAPAGDGFQSSPECNEEEPGSQGNPAACGQIQQVQQEIEELMLLIELGLLLSEEQQQRQASPQGWPGGGCQPYLPYSPSSPSNNQGTPISATGNPSQAVQIAQSQMGKLAQNVQLPDYSHAGGDTNDCADFVSACVAGAGDFKKSSGDVNVAQFQTDLQKQGWQAVAQSQAKPGDVAIILGGGVSHTELVANNGATQCIGSNGTSQEQVSVDNPSSWSSHVTYYAPPQR